MRVGETNSHEGDQGGASVTPEGEGFSDRDGVGMGGTSARWSPPSERSAFLLF